MQGSHWTVNSSNLIIARNCIKLIEKEFEVKLRLSDSEFLEKLGHFAKQTTSNRTLMLASKLAHAAGLKEQWQQPLEAVAPTNVSNNTSTNTPTSESTLTTSPKSVTTHQKNIEDLIKYRGKQYSRFNDQGLEFKGLYRGQPRYA